MRVRTARSIGYTVAVGLTALLFASAATAQESPPAPEQAPTGESRYTVEVLFRDTLEWARLAADRLREELGPEVRIRVEHRAPGHVVRAGDFGTLEEARPVLEAVVELGYVDASITPVPVLDIEPHPEELAIRTDARRPVEPGAAVVPEFERVLAIGPKAATPSPEPPARQPRPWERPTQRKTLQAIRIGDHSPVIDGRLDEPFWSSVTFVSDFEQKGAKRGFPTRHGTDIAVFYDDEALYIGARAHIADDGEVRARTSRRDDGADTDRIIVSLDTYRNRQSAYNFGVTAGGAQIDYYQPRDVFRVRDYSFDPLWDARTDVNGSGWTAEMRIPFSSLRFHAASDPPVWGINIQRVSPAVRLYAFWVVVPGEEAGWASRFGDLVGLEGVEPHRRMAVVPYVAIQEERVDNQLESGPFALEDQEWRFGGEFLMDLSDSLYLEATFNPDFGQIEADPSVINLSAFEVFFPERRPFFIEGADLFEGSGPRYFYSRRIGAPPHGRADADFSDAPDETTILGAAKLVGRRPSGWSVGALAALTDEEDARTFDSETGDFGREPVEPRTAWSVSRLQKDLGAGSTFGIVGTLVSRNFPSSGSLDTLLPDLAVTGGADWNLRFRDQAFEFGGFVGGSLVEGDAQAIQRLQLSSARYYQRPDADYVRFDPDRTSLSGYTAGFHLGRIRGPWQWSVSGEARSPGFELNDAGAMATADDLGAFGELSYRSNPTIGSVRRIDLVASLASAWNFGSVRQYTSPRLDTRVVWRSFWQTYLRLVHDTSALSDSLTRGGPLMETPTATRALAGFSSNDARLWVWSLDAWRASDDLDGSGWGLSTQARVRFADRFTFSIRPGYDQSTDTRQYYATKSGNRPEVFDRRYIFATLEQETLYTRLRMAYAITPSLGVELYIEPFASIGTYDTFGELVAPRTSDLRLYGTDGTTINRLPDGSYVVTDGPESFTLEDGDFDVTSLRGNFVVRWDYRPGSTLYFVWSQTRDASDALGNRLEPGDLVDVLDLPERSVFTIKASFRLDVG